MGYGKHHLPPQLQWGRDNEPVACKCYLERKRVKSCCLSLLTGLFLGASTDGRLICTLVDACCIGCLAITCPYSIDSTLTISLTPDEIAKEVLYGNVHCQGQSPCRFSPITFPHLPRQLTVRELADNIATIAKVSHREEARL